MHKIKFKGYISSQSTSIFALNMISSTLSRGINDLPDKMLKKKKLLRKLCTKINVFDDNAYDAYLRIKANKDSVSD